jgi:cytochrome c peroxidase
MRVSHGVLVLSLLMLNACRKEPIKTSYLPVVPTHFDPLPIPEDNAYSEARWLLGKALFYEPLLSVDSTVSCGTCHQPRLAFADSERFSLGVADRIGTRNVPSLSNVAWHPYYTRDGGVPTLEMQILVPIQEHNEFDFNIVLIAERLNQIPKYITMSQEAYGRDPDAFVITRALANFERTLVSAQSPYDYSLEGRQTLTLEEERGKALFFGTSLNCSSCHGGFDFTDYSITNNGLYLDYADPGRFRVTLDSVDIATFKVPSLRNVALTPPYMHDGSIATLDAVIDHYSSGVQPHQNLDTRVKNFDIDDQEKADLLAFLHTLTDENFISNLNYIQ